jgi:hypothetical protein
MRFTGRSLLVSTALLALALGVLACGGDDDTPTGTGGGPIEVSGAAAKGPIDGGTVNLYRFTSSGEMGALVAGPFTTADNGAWQGEVPKGTDEDLLVVVTGGTYVDEVTGSDVTVGSLYGVWRPSTKVGNATPLTHAIVRNAQERIGEGANVSTAIADAIASMETAVGFDPTSQSPLIVAYPTAKPASTELYWILLAGFSQLVNDNIVSGADLWLWIWAMALDLADGQLDGVVFGDPIDVESYAALDPDGIDAWIQAARDWAQTNGVVITIPDFDLGDFGETDPGGGGPGTVITSADGSLSVSGDPAFGSPFVPVLGAVTRAEPNPAFDTILAVSNATRGVGLALLHGQVTAATANVTGQNEGRTWTNGSQLPPLDGISVSHQGTEWILEYDGLVLEPVVNATANLVLTGTLTLVEQPSGELVVARDDLVVRSLAETRRAAETAP